MDALRPFLELEGGPTERGAGQPAALGAGRREVVRRAWLARLAASGDHLDRPAVRRAIDAQVDLHRDLAPDEMIELEALAEGYGLTFRQAFEALHLGLAADLSRSAPVAEDGCTAVAAGPVLGKNRDIRPEFAALQSAFAEHDPAWRGGAVLSLGSLGVPGAYSSGVNAAGLAVADTAVATTDLGPGVVRYVLMNVLLRRARSVEEALELVADLPHAGGGTLVIADRSGATASVELRHGSVSVTRGGTSVRTNHFVDAEETAPAPAHSRARVATAAALAGRLPMADLLATRGHPPICWVPGDASETTTVSGAIYDTRARTAEIAFGPPGRTPWRAFAYDGATERWRAGGRDELTTIGGLADGPAELSGGEACSLVAS